MTKGRDQGPERTPILNSGAGVGSTSQSTDPKYYFGSPEEIANRVGTGYSAGTHPKDNAPSFQQIGPATSDSGVNDAPLGHREGSMKFSSGPREG